MAAAASSNRFMPLSLPKSPPTSRSSSPSRPDASQQKPRSPSPSPTRSDASEQPRSPSPSPSEVQQPYRSIKARIATYPEKWTYKTLLPRMLASCGLCYYAESDEDACICHECDAPAVPLQKLDADIDLSHDKLLSLHTWDCLLADTLEDLIGQKHHLRILASSSLTAPASMSQSPSSHVTTNPSPESQGPKPSEHAAAAIPTPPPSKALPSPSPPPSPRPVPPAQLSYATVASRPAPTPSSTPSKAPRAPASTPPTQKNTPTPDTTPPTSSKITPQRPRLPQTSSPVLSIYDLERRFHKKPSHLQDHHRHSLRKHHSTAIARLLHAIADLLGSHNPSYILDIEGL